jgi:hypothetical protein
MRVRVDGAKWVECLVSGGTSVCGRTYRYIRESQYEWNAVPEFRANIQRVLYIPMVGDDGETAAGVMLPLPARAASHAGGVEEDKQFDEVAPHADGGEVVVHANDGVEAQVVSDVAMPDAGGDAEVPPNADEVEGVEAGAEIPK